jgi:tRNA (mo5U34)-methyltransferase
MTDAVAGPPRVRFTKEELEDMAARVTFWYHSIDLGQGVVTKGAKSAQGMRYALDCLQLPDLRGKTVLDINTLDGFFAFEAERLGAARVVALDHYLWAMDRPKLHSHWMESKERGVAPQPYHTMPYYHPDTLPGKAGFDTAKAALQSSVEDIVADFMTLDVKSLGRFDVVFYLGSLYHMENPLEAMRRVAEVTGGLAIIETEAIWLPGLEQHGLCEFFESNELNGDVSNWWAPNEKALAGLCRAAGFSSVASVLGPPLVRDSASNVLTRYRSVVHAWK